MSPGGGLRRAPVWVAVVGVLAASGAVVGLGALAPAPRREPVAAPRSVPVASAALVCPAPLAEGTRLATAITAVSATVPQPAAASPTPTAPTVSPPASPSASTPIAPPPSGSAPPAPSPSASPPAASGTAGIGPLGSGAFTPLRTLSALDAPAGFAVTGKSSGPVLAAATGQFAPGLAADQLTRGSDGPLRGLALQPCGPAVSDAWFIGGGSGVGRTTTLYLSNVEDQPSLVDVRMYGAAGELDVPAARGVVVPPHRRVVLALGKIAPAQSTLAVRVIAREGRVSPAVFDNTVAGSQPQGIEYLPLTEARRRIVLPAVLAGEGTRELTLLAPRADAEVRVSMLTQDGAITPVGLESVSLQAGKVTRVRIEQVTAKAGVGLVLRARTPLVGAVRAVLPGQLPDTADVAGTPVLDAAAVVTGITSGRSTALILAAPRKAARVRLTVHAVGGPKRAPVTRELAVASGTTLRATVTVPSGASSAWVLLEPVAGSGPVHAVRRVAESGTRGVLVTTAPVLPLTPRVDIPTALFRVAAS